MKEMQEKTVVSVRLDNDRLVQLQALAEIESSTLADEIRKAVDDFIKSKTRDRKKLDEMIAKDKEKRDLRNAILLKSISA